MSRRCFAQPSLADAFVKAYSRAGGFLEDLMKTIEWSAFDVLFAQINANTKGAPGYPPLTMFKIVLLQHSKALREKLASQGIDDKIAYKAQRNKPLKNWQKWFNTTASSVRSGVERSNATMKNWYGMARVRYLGLARNNCHLQFVACAMNMKRGLVLLRAA